MADVTLYSNPQSRGLIAQWMLEEIGEPHKVVNVEYGAEMKDEKYLAINPMGKVPALVHGNHVVTECAAICAYLADTFPAAKLGPTDSERAAYYRWMFFASGPLEAAITNKSLGVEHNEDKEAMMGYGRLDLVLDTIEGACKQNDYLAGPRFTAVDVYAGSQLGFSMMFGTIESRPAFAEYWERCTSRDAYKRVNKGSA